MKTNIIGRETEIQRLEKYIASPRSELIAIYGRRRVGKTFLVKELFEGRFAFRMTGKENSTTREQLESFAYSLGNQSSQPATPQNWTQAFRMLAEHIEHLDSPDCKIIFIDELPWLDTYGSHFTGALEHFWNDWANYRNDIKLIVCGSATTWMLDNVINARGGLHNRATHTIRLNPFTLRETELYFKSFGFNYERQELIECYMAIGGVAHYLSLFEPDKSVAQNVEALCFSSGGELVDEFHKVFRSLFKKADHHIAVITALQRKCSGMTRQEIIDATSLANNGNLSNILRELEECAFIRSYSPFMKTKKDRVYQIIDPFTLFYLNFMGDGGYFMKNYWLKMQSTAKYTSWCGYAFEVVCLNHLEQIVRALGIDGTINTPCSWSYRPPKRVTENPGNDEDLTKGTQIDLLIDRSDKTISICEIKYAQGKYEITKAYDDLLSRRLRTFRKVTNTTKTPVVAFITPNGLLDNVYSRRIIRNVTGDQLFV